MSKDKESKRDLGVMLDELETMIDEMKEDAGLEENYRAVPIYVAVPPPPDDTNTVEILDLQTIGEPRKPGPKDSPYFKGSVGYWVDTRSEEIEKAQTAYMTVLADSTQSPVKLGPLGQRYERAQQAERKRRSSRRGGEARRGSMSEANQFFNAIADKSNVDFEELDPNRKEEREWGRAAKIAKKIMAQMITDWDEMKKIEVNGSVMTDCAPTAKHNNKTPEYRLTTSEGKNHILNSKKMVAALEKRTDFDSELDAEFDD